MKMLNHWLIAAVATVMTTTVAVAQTNHVAWSKIETGPWTLHPIYAEVEGGAHTVSNFLALADPTAATGDNLIAVCYRREGAEWTTKSWETGDPWEAIKAVKIELGIDDDEDDRWGLLGERVLSRRPGGDGSQSLFQCCEYSREHVRPTDDAAASRLGSGALHNRPWAVPHQYALLLDLRTHLHRHTHSDQRQVQPSPTANIPVLHTDLHGNADGHADVLLAVVPGPGPGDQS